MAIDRLTICDWTGRGKHDTVIDRPTWQDIEAAIGALNNRNLNDLYLQPDGSNPETYLCIGGGAGQYVVSGCVDNEYFPTLVDPQRPSEPRVALVVGGQLSAFPSHSIVDLESALLAARSFYTTGGFGGDVHWVHV
jgi:metal-dependent hydrolase (beta-lactamase superfamily II)